LLYILHIAKENTLEVTDLSSTATGGGRKFKTLREYSISNPSGNENIEGFAISPRLSKTTKVSVWLCRDVENGGKLSFRQDCVRWFYPFIE
jgi:ferredoxin-NADP reductase